MSVAATVAKRIMPLFDRVLVQVNFSKCIIMIHANIWNRQLKLEEIKPKNNCCIFSTQRAVAETKTKGGLIIPEAAQKSPLEATVVAAGPGARNASTGF